MKGLRQDFESLPRTRVITRTTSASGPAREDAFDAIPLSSALERPACTRVTVHAQDGAALSTVIVTVSGILRFISAVPI